MRSVRVYDVEVGFRVKGDARVEPFDGGVAFAMPECFARSFAMTADQALDLARALERAAKDHNDISSVEDDGA